MELIHSIDAENQMHTAIGSVKNAKAFLDIELILLVLVLNQFHHYPEFLINLARFI